MIKIISLGVCGPGEAGRYLEKTLKEFIRLSDDAIIATCHAGKKEIELLDKYDIRHYKDDRIWGIKQPYIKTDLLRRGLKLKPDWIIQMDMDETMPWTTREDLEQLAATREACHFYIVNLWNDEKHYKKTLSFWNIRFYKADESKGVQFLKKPLHCGNAPPYFYCQPARKTYIPHLVLHRGLMLPGCRRDKIKRYDLYDPDAVCKGREYYDALALSGLGAEFNYNKIKESLYGYIEKFREQTPGKS
jgi:hypothetical protein